MIPAFFLVQYDPDATAPFLDKIRKPYGDFVAESVVGPVVEIARAGRGDRLPVATAQGVE